MATWCAVTTMTGRETRSCPKETLSELGMEAQMMAMWAAQRDADQRVNIAQTLISSDPTNPVAARQLEAAYQANQLTAHRTAEVADAVERFVKSGRTHPALSVARDEVAKSNSRVLARRQDLNMFRQSLPKATVQKPQNR